MNDPTADEGAARQRSWMPPLSPVSSATSVPDVDVNAGWMAWVEETGNTPAPVVDLADDAGDGADYSDDPASAVVPDLLADDPMAALAADARERSLRAKRRRDRLVRVGVLAGAVAAVAVVAGGAVLVVADRGDSAAPEPTLVPATASRTASPSATAPAVWCQEMSSATRVVGAGAGDLNTPAGVILYQQYAFYVLRDPDAVRSVLAPDAVAAPVEKTKEAIDRTPAGTKHCVTITPRDASTFGVQITERYPDGKQAGWEQTETTVQRDGRTLITSITAGGN